MTIIFQNRHYSEQNPTPQHKGAAVPKLIKTSSRIASNSEKTFKKN